MKKLCYALGILLIVGVVMVAVLAARNWISGGNGVSTGSEAGGAEELEPTVDLVQEQLDAMTLDEKIAQMMVVDCNGLEVSDGERVRLETTPYGGYILMGEGYGTLEQTRAMVETLQSLAKIPLIITTDQEGGAVQRIQNVSFPQATMIPDMYSVGETGDVTYARTIGRVMAEELRAIGVNVDLAPDTDVYSNPYNTVIGRRSFSSESRVVAEMSQALAEGLEQNGVVATYKHFPGHGDTAVDSHVDLPVIYRTRGQLDEVDLVPFESAIMSGAKLIMTGHIAIPEVTSDTTPASLSHEITTELLRGELGYKGLIITDGLNMGALMNNYAEEEIYLGAVRAGADLLLLPENPQLAADVIRAQIPESRIDESVYRILEFKQNYLVDYKYLGAEYFGSDEHARAVER